MSRLKKCHSEVLPPELRSGLIATDDGSAIDIDELFDFAYSKVERSVVASSEGA